MPKSARYNIVILFILKLLISLVIVEVASRIIWKQGKTLQWKFDSVFEYSPIKPVFENIRNEDPQWIYTPRFPENNNWEKKDFTHRKISRKKTKNIFRIFFLGASTTAGAPMGNWGSFPIFTNKILNAIKMPGADIETINLGVNFFNSEEVFLLLKRVIVFNPDLIVIHTGSCELCFRFNDSNISGFPSWYLWMLDKSYLLRLSFAVWPFKQPFLGQSSEQLQQGLTPSQREALFHRFSTQVNNMTKLAELNKVPIIFLAPLASSVQPPRITNKSERQIEALFKSGNCNQSNAAAKQVLGVDPENAAAHYFLGACSLENKASIQASEEFDLAINNDKFPERFGSRMLDILKNQQGASKQSYFIDTSKRIKMLLKDKIIDGRVVFDRGHSNLYGNYLIADSIVEWYFNKLNIRTDLFDYSKYPHVSFSDLDVNEETYWKVCERLFFEPFKTEKECLRKLYITYTSCHTEVDRRYHARAWEPLMYFSKRTKNNALFNEAIKIRKLEVLNPKRPEEIESLIDSY